MPSPPRPPASPVRGRGRHKRDAAGPAADITRTSKHRSGKGYRVTPPADQFRGQWSGSYASHAQLTSMLMFTHQSPISYNTDT